MTSLREPLSRSRRTAAQTSNAFGGLDSSSLWTDMDSGVGLWDNIPGTIRQAFRALLAAAQTQAQSNLTGRAQADAQLDDLREEFANDIAALKAQALKHENVARKLQNENSQLLELVAKLQQEARSKPDDETVRHALALKADKQIVTEHHQVLHACTSKLEELHDRVSALATDYGRFQEESKNAIIAVTRAANEARTAVSTTLSAAALHESSFASTAMVAAVQEELASFRRDLFDTNAAVNGKADIAAVNEILETKANKATVAQALHNKHHNRSCLQLSVGKVQEVLAPYVARLGELEKDLAITASKAESLLITDKNIASEHLQAILEEKLKNVELRMIAAIEHHQGRMAALDQLGTRDMADCREQLAQLQSKVQHTDAASQNCQAQCEQARRDCASNAAEILRLKEHIANEPRKAAPLGTWSHMGDPERANARNATEPASAETRDNDQHADPGKISVELQCTKRDLRDLASEVRSIVSLLEVGTIDPSEFSIRTGPGMPFNAESAIEVSSVTVIRTIKQTLTQLQQRVSSLELMVDDTRTELAAVRADVVDIRDDKLRRSGELRLADAAIKSIGDRLAEVEACVLLMAPHPQQVSATGMMATGTTLARSIAAIPATQALTAHKHSAAPAQASRRADGRDAAKWRETQTPS